MPVVDLLFPALGDRVPVDHGYPLYAAVCRLFPSIHSGEIPVSIAPLTGIYAGKGQLILDPRSSFLRVRVQHDHVPALLPLTGKKMHVLGHPVVMGAPQISLLTPRQALASRCVLIDDVAIREATAEVSFLAAARKRLDDMGIQAKIEVPRIVSGPRQGEPRRVVVRIHRRALVGYSLVVRELNDADSLKLQEVGLGGRRRMGAGMFVPAEEDRP